MYLSETAGTQTAGTETPKENTEKLSWWEKFLKGIQTGATYYQDIRSKIEPSQPTPAPTPNVIVQAPDTSQYIVPILAGVGGLGLIILLTSKKK